MKKTFWKRLRAGFSLIEVNMAIFVLAGGALALLGLFPLGLRESLAARNDMRVAAFAERYINSVRILAADPEIQDIDDLRDALEGSPFNLKRVLDSEDEVTSNLSQSVSHDDESGVYYRAWVLEDSNWKGNGADTGDKTMVEAGILVTAEDAERNPTAMKYAQFYAVRVLLHERED